MKQESFETAYEIIKTLVEDFKAGEKHYLSQAYQEAEARKDFIDKFFIALGWDVHHNEQKNPYAQEVKVEKGVNVSGAQKRADYSFSLAPNYRDPKFFVEAKKPAQDLYDEDYYFQTIRYGWHKVTPLAVLTDFEEFHILDCRFDPVISTILNRQVKKYHYTEYTDKEKFAEIYWLFSREAVAANSLEKKAAALPKAKGKAGKQAASALEKNQAIDDAFLQEIDELREKLAKAFKKNDEQLTSEELTEATQRTIDRLVFIRFLEDKLIEQEHYVSTFGEKGQAWNDFTTLCKRLEAKYNGIVFKKSFIDADTFKGPDDAEFRAMCQAVCHLNSRFLYNEIPIYILGSIYERFLGKVVHATDKRVKVEEKPEVRKAGGVYYTPKYIVDYIVQNTVGKLIKDKTPQQIAAMRFADIACGSGSFLIGVFDLLMDYHNNYYQQHPDKAKKDGCHLANDGRWVPSIKQKQNILRNNIYGVDIDAQAVEVTQLSLSLKMLEDETTATTNEMNVLFHEKILPDMTKNIVCGNALIGTDILNQDLFSGEESGELERKLNPMDFEHTFAHVFKPKTDKRILNLPDDIGDEEELPQAKEPMIKYEHKIKGGFDAIVGNPPYLSTKGIAEISKRYFLDFFETAKGQFDLYGLFIEQAIKILKTNGMVGYITSNTFLSNKDFLEFRKYILHKTTVLEIVNLGETVFQDANLDVSIVVLEKRIEKENQTKITIDDINFRNNNFHFIKQSFFNNPERNYEIQINIVESEIALLEKIFNPKSTFGNYLELPRGVELGGNAQEISHSPKSGYTKLLVGKNIGRFDLSFAGMYMKLGKDKSVYKEPHIYQSDKILIQRIRNLALKRRIIATYDHESYICTNTLRIGLAKTHKYDLKFFLGILNSQVINYIFQKMFFNKDIYAYQLERIPLPFDSYDAAPKSIRENISKVVDQMLSAKKQLQTAKTDKDKAYYQNKCNTLDRQIDNLVYELYHLTEEEIAVVENKN